jgi:hypothetical protein
MGPADGVYIAIRITGVFAVETSASSKFLAKGRSDVIRTVAEFTVTSIEFGSI